MCIHPPVGSWLCWVVLKEGCSFCGCSWEKVPVLWEMNEKYIFIHFIYSVMGMHYSAPHTSICTTWVICHKYQGVFGSFAVSLIGYLWWMTPFLELDSVCCWAGSGIEWLLAYRFKYCSITSHEKLLLHSVYRQPSSPAIITFHQPCFFAYTAWKFICCRYDPFTVVILVC